MQFHNLMILGLAAFLAGSAGACKCVDGNTNHPQRTKLCCNSLGGVYRKNAKDCDADSISEQLSGFNKCCHAGGHKSDCGCPTGCGKEAAEAEKEMAEGKWDTIVSRMVEDGEILRMPVE